MDPTLEVGRVIKPHGVRGEVLVEPASDNPARFEPGNVLTLKGKPFAISTCRPQGARLLLRFEGIEDRDAAEELRGARMQAAVAETPELPEGSYWAHDLIGYRVVTTSGRDLGLLEEVADNPAHDLWIVRGSSGEISIPAVRDLVDRVDQAAELITVHDLPGLTEPG